MGEDFGRKIVTADGSRWRLDNLYVYLVGVSGAAFRLNRGPVWELDNAAIFHMADDSATPYCRVIEALGYARGKGVVRGQDDEAAFRRSIVEGIRDRGHPVRQHGVIGPSESCLITGYDEGGDVLIGWSYFQGRPGARVGWWGDPNRDGVVE